ncbi:bifunctional folylpolyglutamate synthase/dihydrofolate synthase [Sporolactobacillus shoreae]|uniref:Dihydrofolate synthase/folylpolyglutamate synthase n=1 Tax=Sporolactobacillus shoreae TaxID=1465501 RepID=A0A4Z0GRK1_9BACL|nr:folylpolyglutamate synthase/dihydrofolate synthase family protein [Sporolactobacillus shoreae]TGA99480.1 bifunctional folylpolyglutamate synthase/dihydrofolate synthase [Sporolactobacillus shoreae]
MFTTIEETLDWIHGLIPHGMKPGTQRMEWMLARLGNPERRIRTIHVGGTNGKGSTVSYLRNIYQETGLKVGTFISPYITSFNERIMVNGVPISDGDLVKAANIVYPLTKAVEVETDLGEPAEFESVTMLSFVYFSQMNPCDLVIYEVGLGGRLDSTNVIHPLVSVITNVAMDHMKQLGNTITSIAREKAGIIKKGVGIITTAEHPDALKVIREKAEEKGSSLYILGKEFQVRSLGHDEAGEHFDFDGFYLHERDLTLRMKGEHQLKNAAAALMTVEYLKTFYGMPAEDNEIRSGLEKTAWPGRFERMSENPLIIIDGAHNVQGTEALVQTVNRYYPSRRIRVLYAALEDKQYEKMVRIIETVASEITLTTFSYPRAAESRLLYDASLNQHKTEDSDWRHAIHRMAGETGNKDALLICGSLYFISAVRHYLRNEDSTCSCKIVRNK